MTRPVGNNRLWMRRVLTDAHRHPAVMTAARFLATDPSFCRAVSPQGEGTRVAEAFIVPLVVQAALSAGIGLPEGVPVNDRELERLTGVPRIGEAFRVAGVCTRDAYGFYDLSRVLELIPYARYDKAADDQAYHQRVQRAAKALGYKYESKHPGRVRAFKHWAETQGHNTTLLLQRLLKPEGIYATDQVEGNRRSRRKRKETAGQGPGTTPPAGDGSQETPEGARTGPGVLRRDPPADGRAGH